MNDTTNETPAIEPTQSEIDSLYRERAHLVALLVQEHHGAWTEDPENPPGWIIAYADLPTGQVSWRIAPADRDLFAGARFAPDIVGDGHDIAEKYARIREAIGVPR